MKIELKQTVTGTTGHERLTWLRLLSRKALIYLALCGCMAQAESPNIIYYEAPPADEIADILFKPRYRGIEFNDQPAPQQAANVFGMMINFEFDSIKIVPDSLPMLDAVGRMMQLERVAERRIVIEGHTDAIGGEPYNQHLSERRARAIKRYLISRFKIAADRLVIVGKGETEPHDRRRPANPVNRRVQFRPLV
ncbi:MAG: OmpA family protein [Candidatus Thiodiazotropha sp.]